jgi:serine/threonine-protein kinase HipA
MNGERVGRWERTRTGADRLTYAEAWLRSPAARPLSLSLPLAREALRGPAVVAYFDNLLPDNDLILRRIRERHHAPSTSAFDLLTAVGRDCVGAVQLVPADEQPADPRRIKFAALDEAGVARILRETRANTIGRVGDEAAFRLSLAGAQEKTALLRHRGCWCVPLGATPSTHIFKLPLGRVGAARVDLSDSVELEWLSMTLAGALGLPVAACDIGHFEDQSALIVERFDRSRSRDGKWWRRFPQEDFCQAMALAPTRKYEADGGPGIARIMDLLRASAHADRDRAMFFTAQLAFWLLAVTDGHAKNFSLRLLRGGAWHLTPLYDILSVYPVAGSRAGQLDPHKVRLAMAVESTNRHYRLLDIHRRHWVAMGVRLGLPRVDDLIDGLIARVPAALDYVAAALPRRFPPHLFEALDRGVRGAVQRLAAEPSHRIP